MTRETDQVPAAVRAAAYERDGGICRVCGRFTDTPGLHHIEYKSEGGLNVLENLITIGWTPGHDCHLAVVHQSKRLWQPILKVVVQHDGITGRSLLRWARTAKPTSPPGRDRDRSLVGTKDLEHQSDDPGMMRV